MLTGRNGKRSQARLPPSLAPKGVSKSRINSTLNARIQRQRLSSTSRSTIEKKIYMQIPSSMATPCTITYLLLSRYRVALKISTMPKSVDIQQRDSSTRSACWKKSAKMALSRLTM